MPDWIAPFHMPKFNDEEYLEEKGKYVAEHGYTVTIPALSDIFKFGKTQPMTDQEKYDWRNENWEAFTPDRFYELETEKKHKMDNMLAMLGSPTPEVFAKLGAILTSIDDAQDAISTIAAVGRLTRKIAPKALGRLFSGPIGFLLTVNDILNLLTALGTTIAFSGLAKKYKDAVTGSNPFSKKARLKRLKKLGSWKPTFADIIQAAQTTEQVFGVGVSLGPITGMLQDIMHGTIKMSVGMDVSWKLSDHFVPEWLKLSYSSIKSTAAFMAAEWNSPDDLILEQLLAQAMAQESIMTTHQGWNPLEQITGIEHTLIQCPIPEHPLTLSAMAELGIEVEDVIGWPVLDKEYASPDELTEVYAPLIQDNCDRFIERHNHDSMGCLATSLITDAAMYQLANIEGEDAVEYDYSSTSKLASSLLLSNQYPAPIEDQNLPGVRLIERKLQYFEDIGEDIGYKTFMKYANWPAPYNYKFLDMS